MEGKARWPTNVALVGSVLAILGAALDFYSSYQIMSYPTTGMMESSQAATVWGVGLASLGVLLLIMAVAGVSSLGAGRMALFGTLMTVYGVLMLFLGAAMDFGVSPAMQMASLTGLGMLVVGAVMMVNGFMMLRSGRTPAPDPWRSTRVPDAAKALAVPGE